MKIGISVYDSILVSHNMNKCSVINKRIINESNLFFLSTLTWAEKNLACYSWERDSQLRSPIGSSQMWTPWNHNLCIEADHTPWNIIRRYIQMTHPMGMKARVLYNLRRYDICIPLIDRWWKAQRSDASSKVHWETSLE